MILYTHDHDIDSYELDRVTPIWHDLARSYQYHDEHPIKKFAETLYTHIGIFFEMNKDD